MEWADLLICANSRMDGGHCVAGLRTDGGGWVRPVWEDGVSLADRECSLGFWRGQVRPLQVVRLPLERALPEPYHPEDWLLGPGRWRFVRAATADDFDLLRSRMPCQPRLPLPHGRVELSALRARPLTHSLVVLRAPGAMAERQARADRRPRFLVHLDEGVYRSLPVTDAAVIKRMGRLAEGVCNLASLCRIPPEHLAVVVSVTRPFAAREGDPLCCYHVVAAVMNVPPATGG
jgi:hypothetical protein